MSFARFVPHLQRSAFVAAIVIAREPSTWCDKPTSPKVDHQTMLISLRPSKEEYEVVDWRAKKYEHMVKNNALFDTLYGEGRVEAYEVYKHKTKPEIIAILKFGNTINGYPHILHGGISALVIDNSYGMLFMSQNLPPAFTANLDINYRSPVKENSYCVLRAEIASVEGRKLRMKASIEDAVTKKVQVESTTLFINMKLSTWQVWAKQIADYFGYKLV